MGKELTPREVLTELFEEDGEWPSPQEAADLIIRRLTDAGFTILDLKRDDKKPVFCRACGTLSYSGRCDCTRAGIREVPDGPHMDK